MASFGSSAAARDSSATAAISVIEAFHYFGVGHNLTLPLSILTIVVIGAVNWLDMARIVRGQTLSLKNTEFVEAARACGVDHRAIIRRHIVPNLLGVVMVYITLTIPQVILVESFLSFLGLGVQEPQTSLGSLVNGGVAQMEAAPWLLLIPAALLALILMAFNFLGDGLRDYFDARKSS